MEIQRDIYLNSLRKVIIIGGSRKPRRDENGIVTMGIRNFLTDDNSLSF